MLNFFSTMKNVLYINQTCSFLFAGTFCFISALRVKLQKNNLFTLMCTALKRNFKGLGGKFLGSYITTLLGQNLTKFCMKPPRAWRGIGFSPN